MVWTPRATVAAIIPSRQGVLCVEENRDNKVVVNQPAGHIEKGESIEAAVHREVMEETGWEITLKAFLGIYVLHIPEKDLTYHRYCFIADPVQQITEKLDRDILRACWLQPDAILRGDYPLRSPLVSRCVSDYVQGRHFPLDIIHTAIQPD